MLAVSRAELLPEESAARTPDAPASYSARVGLCFRSRPALAHPWPHARMPCAVSKAGASSPFTRRKAFFRNGGRSKGGGWRVTDLGKETGQHQSISVHTREGLLSPSQKQALLKKLPSSRMPRTGIFKDLRKSFQAFSLKSRCNPL